MGRKFLMSWRGHPYYDWRKTVQGHPPFRVTCEELGLHRFDWTKEGSYLAANAWWERRLAELTHPSPEEELRNRHPIADLKEQANSGRRLTWAAEEMLDLLNPQGERAQAFARGMLDGGMLDYETNRGHFRMVSEMLGGKPVEKDKTLRHQAERFLAVELDRGLKPGTYGDLAYYINRLQTDCPLLPETFDVTTINEQTVTDFYRWIKKTPYCGTVQKKVWDYFRRLVRFLAGQRLCPVPLNLDDRIHSFGSTTKQVKVYPLEDVRELLATLPQRLKLYACLALNCGMLGVDMADLRHDELRENRIIRQRTKTRDASRDVPTVGYPLWPETLELLRRYPRSQPEFVLTSKTGTPLWKADIVDGKKKKYDLVSLQWQGDVAKVENTSQASP
jgi:hypothetical protein